MKGYVWSRLRAARYALPGYLAGFLPVPGVDAVLRQASGLQRRGMAATLGYFHDDNDTPSAIVSANLAALARARDQHGEAIYLSIKAPALAFDRACIAEIAGAAARDGRTVVFDSLAPKDASRTLELTELLQSDFPGTGCVLPARWRRSGADAARLRDLPARIRIVKGEWADPEADPGDIREAYLDLVSLLAGRTAPVAVATHDPVIAEPALRVLLAAGTPCELEQLRGMPCRRTTAIARRLGVPIRMYLPFGPGWWPYAINKALAHPKLLLRFWD